MERTSSLDLLRGSADSGFFSDLNFLDIQEPDLALETADTQPPSQAIPSSLPLQQSSAKQGQTPAVFHSSSYPLGHGYGNAWPQLDRHAQAGSHQARSFPDAYLHPSPAAPHRSDALDSQPDSSTALLNDDTALGFADDCFRRESDIYASYERAGQLELLASDASRPPSATAAPSALPESLAARLPNRLTVSLQQQQPAPFDSPRVNSLSANSNADSKHPSDGCVRGKCEAASSEAVAQVQAVPAASCSDKLVLKRTQPSFTRQAITRPGSSSSTSPHATRSSMPHAGHPPAASQQNLAQTCRQQQIEDSRSCKPEGSLGGAVAQNAYGISPRTASGQARPAKGIQQACKPQLAVQDYQATAAHPLQGNALDPGNLSAKPDMLHKTAAIFHQVAFPSFCYRQHQTTLSPGHQAYAVAADRLLQVCVYVYVSKVG